MRMFEQVAAITLLNIKSLAHRLGTSSVIVVGICGVVAVLVALLSMAQGFRATLEGEAPPSRIIVVREGATSEINGAITFEQAAVIRNLRGISRSDGTPMIGFESYVSVNIPKQANASAANVPFRGVSAASFDVRPEFEIVEGRMFEFGRNEIVVGVGAANQFAGLSLGESIRLRNVDWQVVGLFQAQDSIHQSEIWTDVLMLNAAFNRGSNYSSLVAELDSSDSFALLEQQIAADRRLTAKPHRVTDYYSAQSESTSQLILGVGYLIIAIMAVGSVFAVLNTMHAAISTRSVEIATLRAIGFGATPLVLALMLEALLLALLGGAIGAGISYALFNGFTASTMGSNTQVSFDFLVSAENIKNGIVLAAFLGLLGGLLPAIRAARIDIASGLREF